MRLSAYVSGRVQKAGYRARVVALARALDLTGTVQNLEDGRVKVLAEGDEVDLRRLQKGLTVKNSIIDVIGVEASYSQATGDYEEFFKLVGSGETDERLDTGIEYLKELIDVNEKGFQTLGDKMDGMQECQETTLHELRGLRSDLKEHIDCRFDHLEGQLASSRTKRTISK